MTALYKKYHGAVICMNLKNNLKNNYKYRLTVQMKLKKK